MNLTQVIQGDIVTEKAERLKGEKVHVLKVHPKATKIDVGNALRRSFFAMSPSIIGEVPGSGYLVLFE